MHRGSLSFWNVSLGSAPPEMLKPLIWSMHIVDVKNTKLSFLPANYLSPKVFSADVLAQDSYKSEPKKITFDHFLSNMK